MNNFTNRNNDCMFYVRKNYLITFQILFIIFLSFNCSQNNKDIISEGKSDTNIYKSGLSYLRDDNYKEAAIELYEKEKEKKVNNTDKKQEIIE